MDSSLQTIKAMAKNATYGCVIADGEGYLLWANSAFTQICGYALDELIGRKPGLILQGRETDLQSARCLSQAIQERQPCCVEILNYHKSGSTYWVRVDLTPFFVENSSDIYFTAIETEIPDSRHKVEILQKQIVELYGSILTLVEERSNMGGEMAKAGKR
jgi:PAS domain S-box-containing protein